MTYGEFLEKITALIPPPKSHLVRWSGSLAPNSKYRKKIILNPEEKKGFNFDDEEGKSQRNYTWAKLLARVFGIDALKCKCGGDFTPICAVKETQQVRRYLKHMGLEDLPPARAPPRSKVHHLDFNQDERIDDLPVIRIED